MAPGCAPASQCSAHGLRLPHRRARLCGGDISALTDQQGSSPGHLTCPHALSGAPALFQAVLVNSDPTAPPAPLTLSGAALPPLCRVHHSFCPSVFLPAALGASAPAPLVLCESSLSPRNGSVCSQVNADSHREQPARLFRLSPHSPPATGPRGSPGSRTGDRGQEAPSALSSWLSSGFRSWTITLFKFSPFFKLKM